jgi:hypothetical protein
MPEVDPAGTDAVRSSGNAEDDTEEDLAAAYEALDEDRRRQEEERAAAQGSRDRQGPGDDELETNEPPDDATQAPEPPAGAVPPAADAEPALLEVADASNAVAPGPAAAAPTAAPTRRVFVIDNKDYPDPDPDLPITGARSVQAMYRDYFPGQLDNADVVQKTRPDGALEVTFKRRIGTKGTRPRSGRRRASSDAGEVAITIAGIVGVLARLAPDRPLAWDLVEQAVDAKGRVRLDFVPPAAELNLAEAQQQARTRLIQQAVADLRRLRPGR